MKNKDSYPKILLEMLSRNLDMTDYVLNYLDYKGQVFSNDIGKVTKGKYPLLLQYDTRWGYGMYGDDVIAINGCEMILLLMILQHTHIKKVIILVVQAGVFLLKEPVNMEL